MPKLTPAFALALTTALALAPGSRAQCPPAWLPGDGFPGLSAPVTASTVWDPDGPGPLPSQVVVGGVFAGAGGVTAFHIAAWDGVSWHPLGLGVNGTVYALTTYHGDLIAAGSFTSAGGVPASKIARWDGSSWQPLGIGLDGTAAAMTVYHDELIVSGRFAFAGGFPANGLARWNGSEWRDLGAIVSSYAEALIVHGDELVVGGSVKEIGGINSPRVAMWNGSKWRAPATFPPTGIIRAMTEFNGELVITATASSSLTLYFARWRDPAWEVIGTGEGGMSSLAVFHGDLYASQTGTINSVPTGGVARFNGAQWFPASPGQTVSLSTSGSALAVFNDMLILTGHFNTVGAMPAQNIACWDGDNWHGATSGFDTPVSTMTEIAGQLVVGGGFGTAPGTQAKRVAAWDGVSWHALGAGVAPGLPAGVQALSTFQGAPVAGARILVSSQYMGQITRWDGAAWKPLGDTLRSDISFAAAVRALATYNGSLYAAGTFSSDSSGHTLSNIARWNGTKWADVGGGVSGDPSARINALALYHGELIAAGNFSTAGATPAAGLARWNGSSWQPLGEGTTGTVYALAVYHDELIAAGFFSSIGSQPSGGLGAWNGTQWRSIGAVNNTVYALAVLNDTLFAAGNFITINGTPAANIARWDGALWQPIDAGVDGTVTALGTFNGELALGGSFRSAGPQVSTYFARWAPAPTAPQILADPQPLSTCLRDSVHLSIQTAGTAPVSLQWRRNGLPLSDGPTPGGGQITGSHTRDLVIDNPWTDSSADYDCVLSNLCGSVTTAAAAVTLCAADLDCNGFVNGDDLDSFTSFFNLGDHRADIDHNGFVNADDYDLFLPAFNAGC